MEKLRTDLSVNSGLTGETRAILTPRKRTPKNKRKKKKVTNGPNLITQSESQAPEVIVVDKLRTDLSVNSGLTGETRASVTP